MLVLFVMTALSSQIVEVGRVNIIDQPSNPSNGLAYLDSSIGLGKSLVDSIDLARDLGYSDVRLATPEEWDNLFEAAGVEYISGKRPNNAFLEGMHKILYDNFGQTSEILIDTLGSTADFPNWYRGIFLNSDPDGLGPDIFGQTPEEQGTRDILGIINFSDGRQYSSIGHSSVIPGEPNSIYQTWLLVSPEAGISAVPEPSALALLLIALGICLVRRIV